MPRRVIRYYMLITWRRVTGLLRRTMTPHTHPRELARGAAVGIVIGLSPLVGAHLLLALLLAYLLRANKLLALSLVFVSNPWTIIPIYVMEGQIGERVMQSPDRLFTVRAVRTFLHPERTDETLWFRVKRILTLKQGEQVAERLCIGWLALGVPAGAAAYFLVLRWANRIYKRRLRWLKFRLRKHHPRPSGTPSSS